MTMVRSALTSIKCFDVENEKQSLEPSWTVLQLFLPNKFQSVALYGQKILEGHLGGEKFMQVCGGRSMEVQFWD